MEVSIQQERGKEWGWKQNVGRGGELLCGEPLWHLANEGRDRTGPSAPRLEVKA